MRSQLLVLLATRPSDRQQAARERERLRGGGRGRRGGEPWEGSLTVGRRCLEWRWMATNRASTPGLVVCLKNAAGCQSRSLSGYIQLRSRLPYARTHATAVPFSGRGVQVLEHVSILCGITTTTPWAQLRKEREPHTAHDRQGPYKLCPPLFLKIAKSVVVVWMGAHSHISTER